MMSALASSCSSSIPPIAGGLDNFYLGKLCTQTSGKPQRRLPHVELIVEKNYDLVPYRFAHAPTMGGQRLIAHVVGLGLLRPEHRGVDFRERPAAGERHGAGNSFAQNVHHALHTLAPTGRRSLAEIDSSVLWPKQAQANDVRDQALRPPMVGA